jgi:hypothetical protein
MDSVRRLLSTNIQYADTRRFANATVGTTTATAFSQIPFHENHYYASAWERTTIAGLAYGRLLPIH